MADPPDVPYVVLFCRQPKPGPLPLLTLSARSSRRNALSVAAFLLLPLSASPVSYFITTRLPSCHLRARPHALPAGHTACSRFRWRSCGQRRACEAGHATSSAAGIQGAPLVVSGRMRSYRHDGPCGLSSSVSVCSNLARPVDECGITLYPGLDLSNDARRSRPLCGSPQCRLSPSPSSVLSVRAFHIVAFSFLC